MVQSTRPGLPQVRSAPPVAPAPPIAFGNRAGLFHLVLKNTLLTLVTLGIYRFWARTALRRFWWGNVAIAGERLEYTGTGAELFVGFLIAIAILAPTLGGFTVIRLLTDPLSIWAAVEAVVYGLTIYVLIAAAIFRARRYRLSRTRWRGVRFAQDGSTWRYIGLTLAWSALAAITLGLAFPWLRWAQQRYLMRCTLFGDRRFSFEGSARVLIWRWLLVLAPLAIAVAAMGFLFVMMFEVLIEAGQSGADPTGNPVALDPALQAKLETYSATSFPISSVALVFAGLAFLAYRVAELRAFAGSTRLGAVAVRSRARFGPVIASMLKGLGLYICLLLAMMVVAFPGVIVHAIYPASAATAWISIVIVVVVIFFLGVSLIMEMVVRFGILRHVVTTLGLSDVHTLAEIAQSTAAAPGTGEGLADAFDVGPM